MNETLKTLRERIDALDEQIQSLISERARCAQAVAETKLSAQGDPVFYRPEREAEVLRQVMARNAGPLPDETIARLFREIMSACLALESPMSIAFLGPEGTFTQEAALKHFGHAVATRPVMTIDAIFREVESGTAHYGVVPVENSTEGVVSHTLDRFIASPLKICGEVVMRIHHHLLGRMSSLGEVRRIYSHRQSLAQCRAWLTEHLTGVERIDVSSNAEAARLAMDEPGAAAIASDAAATIYGLSVLASNIEDEPNNTTRFLVIGPRETPASGQDKTSLVVSAPNCSGSLLRLIEPFSRHGLSMSRLESRPSRREAWEYVYFIDVDGHSSEPALAQALAEVQAQATLFKVLGSYPRAVL